jgi:hypothetical protein
LMLSSKTRTLEGSAGGGLIRLMVTYRIVCKYGCLSRYNLIPYMHRELASLSALRDHHRPAQLHSSLIMCF